MKAASLQRRQHNVSPDLEKACDCGCVSAPSRPGVRRHLSLLPTILLVLLPKCPLCLAAWLGVFGSFGANRWVNAVWGVPLAIGLLSVTVGALALRSWRSRDLRPALIGLLGAASLITGKFLTETPLWTYRGLALLVVASLLSAHRPLSSIQNFYREGIIEEARES